jgi:hypothetical protein
MLPEMAQLGTEHTGVEVYDTREQWYNAPKQMLKALSGQAKKRLHHSFAAASQGFAAALP